MLRVNTPLGNYLYFKYAVRWYKFMIMQKLRHPKTPWINW